MSDLFKQKTAVDLKFDLEQEILRAWGVVDDLELLYHNMDKLTEDQQMNAMLGIIEITKLKFEKMFATFEQMSREIR